MTKKKNVKALAMLRLEPSQRVFSESEAPEWAFGFITKHRVMVACLMTTIGAMCGLAFLVLWPYGQIPVSYVEHVWAAGQYLWLMGVPACGMGLLGLLLYRRTPLVDIKPIEQLVVWRIVSCGKNVTALLATLDEIYRVMKEVPLFRYQVEVITEEGMLGNEIISLSSRHQHVSILHVPKGYTPPNRTGKKARALEYALRHSPVPDTAWLVHLDEESRPTESAVLGVARMIREEENSGTLRIGQGPILYHRLWKTRFFWTLVDCTRTGQDFGPFFLQTRFGISLYGFHGSYIVIRNDVEKAVGGFDLGPKGQITEDAWWVLVANAAGHKIRWVDGFIEEQSVQSWTDFRKQRGRWFYGLRQVVRHAPVSWWRRLPLRLSILLWMMVWASIPYSVLHALYGFQPPLPILLLAMMSWIAYAALSVVGLWANLRARNIRNPAILFCLTVLQVVLVPVYCGMEITAALWNGVIYPEKNNGFYVIKK